MRIAPTPRLYAYRRKSGRSIVLIGCLVLIFCSLVLPLPTTAKDVKKSKNRDVNSDDDDHDEEDIIGANLDPHPDPNEEHYEGMIYVGRHHHIERHRRLSLNEVYENGIKYLFGTSFDEAHKEIEERDLLHHDTHPFHPDVADRGHGPVKTREQVLQERRHRNVTTEGPKPYGHVETHPLDGGVTPVKVVHVEPFFLDATLVTNKQFAKFVKSTYYETEAETYGWSFVLESFYQTPSSSSSSSNESKSSSTSANDALEVDPEAEHWVAVPGAYWRHPEGPDSSYKYRENHPVVHVTHRDAAEYCQWMGKRLPGEWEWEAAARTVHTGPNNRTLYAWGDSDDWNVAKQYANLWGAGKFPFENKAEDGWRGTSPVQAYPPNSYGFYDLTGNVWEWMRGGKHKARIVRGASYVDSLTGESNHAATLGARTTLHGTTSTGNVGFRCAKSPRKRVEYHYKWHDEAVHGQLAVEDQFGKRDLIPQRGWEDHFDPDNMLNDEDEFFHEDDVEVVRKTKKRRKVVKQVERLSTEL